MIINSVLNIKEHTFIEIITSPA